MKRAKEPLHGAVELSLEERSRESRRFSGLSPFQAPTLGRWDRLLHRLRFGKPQIATAQLPAVLLLSCPQTFWGEICK